MRGAARGHQGTTGLCSVVVLVLAVTLGGVFTYGARADGWLLQRRDIEISPSSRPRGVGTSPQLLSGHTSEVFALAFSPDGRLLASGSADHAIRLWDTSTGREVGVLQGHTGMVRAVTFSRDGRYLVSGGTDSTVRVWDVVSRGQLRALGGRFGAVHAVAFSPDMKLVVSGGTDGTLRLFDWAAGQETRVVKKAFGVMFLALLFSPDGSTLATGSTDGRVGLWDLASMRERAALTGHGGAVRGMAFSAGDAGLLASASADGRIRLWDAEPGREVGVFGGHRGEVNAVAFFQDGRFLVSAGQDGTVRMWDVKSRREAAVYTEQPGPVWAVAVTTDGAVMASGGREPVIRLHRPAPLVATAPPPEPTPQRPPVQRAPAVQRPAAAPGPPPVVALAAPRDGVELQADRLRVSGAAASPRGIVRVQISANGVVTTPDAREEAARAASGAVPENAQFTAEVRLVEGANDVTITAVDGDGQVSTLTRTVVRVVDRGTVWAVVIGISRYRHVRSLRYADKDAVAFHDYLIAHLGVPKPQVTLLTNEAATLTEIKRQLGTELRRKAGPRDTVIIYYAGHGAPEPDAQSPDGDGLEKYIVPHDGDGANLYATALPMKELDTILYTRLVSDRVVLITDACYSGASTGRTFATAGLRGTISDAFLARLSRAKGRLVLTASAANEVSEERESLGHGVFTYYLLEGLRGKADLDGDGVVTAEEIYSYVAKRVPEATGRNQNPTRHGGVEGQLVLGRIR